MIYAENSKARRGGALQNLSQILIGIIGCQHTLQRAVVCSVAVDTRLATVQLGSGSGVMCPNLNPSEICMY